jgi:hypothetical protein
VDDLLSVVVAFRCHCLFFAKVRKNVNKVKNKGKRINFSCQPVLLE